MGRKKNKFVDRAKKSTKNDSFFEKLTKYINSDEFTLAGYMKLLANEIHKSGGMKQFLQDHKEFAPELRKIALQSGDKVSKWAPQNFPELGLTEKKLKTSYKEQIEIYDEIISTKKENDHEEESPVIGEGVNDQE